MYRLAIFPSIFVAPMNIQLYSFGKASLECLGQQGGSKNLPGHSPDSTVGIWKMSQRPSWTVLRGEALGRGFNTQTGSRKPAYQPSSPTSSLADMERLLTFLNLSVLGVQADGRMICLCKVLGTS